MSAKKLAWVFLFLAVFLFQLPDATYAQDRPRPIPRIKVSQDKRDFVLEPGGQTFHPWGFNYDHDSTDRLIEDYWDKEWSAVESDFAEMKQLGANVVRIHLQFGRFMRSPTLSDPVQLDRLQKLLDLAESHQMYLDLTGLGCYHKQDVPDWYDALDEAGRWAAQANFWKAVASQASKSPAVFCYDLMNEPVVPGGRRAAKDWLGPAFAGKHFVQVITLDQDSRPRPEIAQLWINHLVQAIRTVDQQHLITVGLVDWSLDRPGLTSGFIPSQVAKQLDFICVHLYPETGKTEQALETLRGFQIGMPVVIEETFPLKCSMSEMKEFLTRARAHSAGCISFYWGQTIPELKATQQFRDAVIADWLQEFTKLKP